MNDTAIPSKPISCKYMYNFLRQRCNEFKTNDDHNKYYCQQISKIMTEKCYLQKLTKQNI